MGQKLIKLVNSNIVPAIINEYANQPATISKRNNTIDTPKSKNRRTLSVVLRLTSMVFTLEQFLLSIPSFHPLSYKSF